MEAQSEEFEGEVVESPAYFGTTISKERWRTTGLLQTARSYPSGGPVLFLNFEDACPHVDMVDDDLLSIDCGSCRHYHPVPRLSAGVCRNEKNALRQRIIAPEQTRST